MTAGVRERARDALLFELAQEIFDVFAERGFEEVTVDEAARAAGISRATFFRYFGSKEDAVVAALEATPRDYGAILRALPAREGESAWALVRRAFEISAEVARARPALLRARARLLSGTPSVRARLSLRRAEQEASLADALTERLGDALAARALAAAAVAAHDLAWRVWSESDEPDLGVVLDAVFGRLASPGTPAPAQGASSQTVESGESA